MVLLVAVGGGFNLVGLEVLTELHGVGTVWLTRDSSYKGGGKTWIRCYWWICGGQCKLI